MTNGNLTHQNLSLYRSLFKGREDVFSIHWQKGEKSGFMPAYHYDPYMYRLHKRQGGNFRDYKNKQYLRLTDDQVLKHLRGEHLAGIYPLLQDNTSWFIAADFDKENWAAECRQVIEVCRQKEIPAYLERSRSGQGGHIWIFFEQPYPAVKSRKFFTRILEDAGILSVFDKNSSFDRLFPNQDFHSGKGLGNLIALPFHKPALDQANSCFINPETLKAYNDQWTYLRSIKKVLIEHLETLNRIGFESISASHQTDKLPIILRNEVLLNREAMPLHLVNFLKEALNFPNADYFKRKKAGRSTWNIPSHFKFLKETESSVSIPRGFIGKLLRYCQDTAIKYEFLDHRGKFTEVLFHSNLNLRTHQKIALEAASRKDFGVIVAPPGSGKTVIGLQVVSEKKLPALIIVHRKQLMEQWIERIPTFLGIPKNEIGKIGAGKIKIGKKVTVAMIQSLGKQMRKDNSNLRDSFGTILLDECHHIPAETYRNTFSNLSPRYQYGLTATPFRKGNDDQIIFLFLGEVITQIQPKQIENFKTPKILIRITGFDVPFNPKTDQFEALSKILLHDSTRNKLILRDISVELNRGKKAVIITERREHISTLHHFLKQHYEVIILSGEDSEKSRKAKWDRLKNGSYQVLITTGQFFGEGSDLDSASCLFLVYPFSFKGKLIQYIGRVQRSEITPVIYDYRDYKINYLNKLFLKRNKYYRQLEKQISLFDDFPENEPADRDSYSFERELKIPIQQLEFRFGAIAFKYLVNEMNTELEFQVENDEFRPEFEVLKPYFAKLLSSKNVNVKVHAEFQYGKLIAQIALSDELERISKEAIEAVKFQFVQKKLIRGNFTPDTEKQFQNLEEFQDLSCLYNSAEDLLENILSKESYKHQKQLRYLAARHNGEVLKIRFVLQPFSFVFLIKGTKRHHIILETLDTEEATYIWHLDTAHQPLPQHLNQIDEDLNLIRKKGRKYFLGNPPTNFSRILHDYSDDRKGFVLWKNQLQERLI